MQPTDYFATKLACETDVSDVATALATGAPGFLIVDSRSKAAWDAGHVPGAMHLPTGELDARIGSLDKRVSVVTYCWGPGCNGATRSALALARRGFAVREMIGGFEYWVREGGTVETSAGLACGVVDRLTALSAIDCGC